MLTQTTPFWRKPWKSGQSPIWSRWCPICCRSSGELNARVEDFADPRVSIIDDSGRVHMAHMDIHYGFSVNGVAALHTEILKESELKPFYDLYPEKFNNKTNGITFRRWLLHCNPKLTGLIERLIGSGFKKNADELKSCAPMKKMSRCCVSCCRSSWRTNRR